jgi:hypothetical protein
MIRLSFAAVTALLLALAACSSDDTPAAATPSGGSALCPNVAGTWKVTAHCDASLIGADAVVTQSGCALTFAAPFNGFTGDVGADGATRVSGPQTCTGTASPSKMTLACTPGTCSVELTK